MSRRNNSHGDLDDYVISSAKYYSLKLIRRGFYPQQDLEDLQQEFILFYLKYADGYDPTRSSFKHYITILFQSLHKNLVREYGVGSNLRDHLWLDDFPDDQGGNKHIIPEGSLKSEPSFFMSQEFVDLSITIDRIPYPELRLICLLILEGYSLVEIAAQLNCSRKTLYRKLKQLRKYFS